jgi:hypothetical protein
VDWNALGRLWQGSAWNAQHAGNSELDELRCDFWVLKDFLPGMPSVTGE